METIIEVVSAPPSRILWYLLFGGGMSVAAVLISMVWMRDKRWQRASQQAAQSGEPTPELPNGNVLGVTAIIVVLVSFGVSVSGLVTSTTKYWDDSRVAVLDTISAAHDLTSLQAVESDIHVCAEDDKGDVASYVWKDSDGTLTTGVLHKEAEQNGSCVYTLTTGG